MNEFNLDTDFVIFLIKRTHSRTSCLSAVRATPLGNGKSVTDRSTANTFKFYRFVCQDKNKLVSISVKSVTNKNGYSAYDGVDLYVTNQYNGLVAVGKEKYVWRCTNSNSSSIEIHPSDSQVTSKIFIVNIDWYCDVLIVMYRMLIWCVKWWLWYYDA